jgi:hypothetical protein
MQTAAQATVPIQLVAEDQAGGSGVTHMRIATDSAFTNVEWTTYSATTQVIAQPGQRIYIQVRDAANNVSAVTSLNNRYRLHIPLIKR